jgi:hypothetical protein
MISNRYMLIILGGWLMMAGALRAQPPTTPTQPVQGAAPVAEEALAQIPTGSTAEVGSIFNTIRRIEYYQGKFTDTEITLSDRVVIDGDQLSLKCDKAFIHLKTKIIEAHGTPIEIRLQDGIRAKCRKFTLDLAKRTTVLEGDPEIESQMENQPVRAKGDVITIVQPEGGGQPSITIQNNPDSPGPAIIEGIPGLAIDGFQKPGQTKPSGDGTPGPTPTPTPTKINGDNVGEIPMPKDTEPELSTGSGS